MRTHTGEKPYQCNVCFKKVAQSAAFKSHMQTHTGEKGYQCKSCVKTFARSDYLNKHMLSHSGIIKRTFNVMYVIKLSPGMII